MKRIILSCFAIVLVVVGTARTQTTAPVESQSVRLLNGLTGSASEALAPGPKAQPRTAAQPTATTYSALSYYDASLPSFDWLLGADYGGLVIPIMYERFTLPAATGFVDSVAIQIDSTTADTLTFALVPVTVVQNGIMVFDPTAGRYALTTILGSQVNKNGMTTVTFPHVAVDQNFIVFVATDVDLESNIYRLIYLRGDLEPTRVRTAENMRSGFLGFQNQQYISTTLDSIFIPNGMSEPVFSNFYMTAYVATNASGVNVTSPKDEFHVYPNPAVNAINVDRSTDDRGTTFEIHNALGTPVLTGMAADHLNVSTLPQGAYQLLLRTEAGDVKRTGFVIAR